MTPFNRFFHSISSVVNFAIFFPVVFLIVAALVSCNKQGKTFSAESANGGINKTKALGAVNPFLKDSLSPGAYDSLEFSQVIVDTATNGNLFLRFPSLGDPVSRRFVLVETTTGGIPLKAACFLIHRDTAAATTSSPSMPMFNGFVSKTWLNGSVAYTSPVANCYILALHPDKSVAAAESNKSTDSDFDGTGETLPDILIEAPLAGDEVIYYLELGEMIEEGGGTGLYEPASGGASIAMLGNPALSARPAINLKGYLGCFGLLPTSGARYSVTIYASIPTSNPTVLTNGAGVPGQAFIGLSMTSGSQQTNQYFGFFPVCDACASNGQAIASKMVDMSGAAYNASYTIQISQAQFNDLISYLGTSSTGPYQQSLSNSSDFAFDSFNDVDATGLGAYLVPGAGTALTPNGIFLAIEQKAATGATGAYANATSQSSVGASHGNCGGSTGGAVGLTTAP
ncbi:MAG: hypothetical protein P4L51_06080 [Puia sp.]|nr:hypothetical protein [Puia sp.]